MFTLKLLVSRAVRWSVRSSFAMILGGLAIVIDLSGLSGSSGLLLIGGLATASYGLFDLGRGIRADRLAIRGLYEDKRDAPLVSGYESPYNLWPTWSLDSWHAVHHPGVDDLLQRGKNISVERRAGLWKPDGEAEEVRRLRHLSIEFDESKIRLCSDIVESTDSVLVQKTKYSAFLVTNKLGIVSLMKSREMRAIDAEKVLFREGRIPRLNRSLCSNHLGVDVLAVVDDGRVWTCKQTAQNQLSPELLAPSGSGSVDWQDLDGLGDLRRTLVNAMRRELSEELGQKVTLDTGSIRLLGYARLTHLGGKPQFFGMARLSSADPTIRAAERLWVADHVPIEFDPNEGVVGMQRSLRLFEHKRRTELSFPLYINIRLLDRWLASDPAAAVWLGLTGPRV